jgi:hypothetical protein
MLEDLQYTIHLNAEVHSFLRMRKKMTQTCPASFEYFVLD